MVKRGGGFHLLAVTRCQKSPRARCSRRRGARRAQAGRRGRAGSPPGGRRPRVEVGRVARAGPLEAPSAPGTRRLPRVRLAPGRDRRQAGGSVGPALPRDAGPRTASSWRLRCLFRVEKRAGARPAGRRRTKEEGRGGAGRGGAGWKGRGGSRLGRLEPRGGLEGAVAGGSVGFARAGLSFCLKTSARPKASKIFLLSSTSFRMKVFSLGL